MDRARSALGDSAFSAAFADGRAQPEAKVVGDVIGRLVGIAANPEPLVMPPSYPAGLSEREVDVLRLVAAGMTNAQVADRLFLSRRTVEAHLRRIYDRLDISSRTQATRFAVEHHLL
jgi:DNA-binding NarL/FixJ family response regulator